MYKSILIPTDGSALSQKAVREAVALAKLAGAKLVALNVAPKFSGSPYGTFGPSEDILEEAHKRQSKASAEQIFAGIRKVSDASGVAFEAAHVISNDVHTQILAVAKKKKCDLICMASHGRRGLAGMVLGSETHKVLTHSKIPVLVLR